MIIKSLILVTQCLFHLLQPGANGPPSCAVYISFSGTENIICFYNLSALPESLHLQGSSSSSPMSLFFLSFLLTAPRGGVCDSESQNGKWVLEMEKLRVRRHPRELPETTVFPLIFKCLGYKPGEKILYGFQSVVWKNI